MYYSEMNDYVGDKVIVILKSVGEVERTLLKGLYVKHQGQRVPVTLNGWRSNFILDKERKAIHN